MTCSLAPTAVGTSPTGLSGAAARRGVSARRRAVGPTRRLCIVYTRYKVLGPIGRSREVLRGVSTVRKILVLSDRTRVGKGLTLCFSFSRPAGAGDLSVVRTPVEDGSRPSASRARRSTVSVTAVCVAVGGRVAAAEGQKSETFFRDPKILKNHAVERLTAAT